MASPANGTHRAAKAAAPRTPRPELGLEARAERDDHLDTRMWLRLLACSTDIEQAIRQQLRLNFGTTLSRFDYLAQLDRHPEGLRMSELSACLMVTGGNVTGLTDQLVQDGSVERLEDPQDRRVWRVRLTPEGRRRFRHMAVEHERWLSTLFKPLPATDKRVLLDLLGRLRRHMQAMPPTPPKRPPSTRTTRKESRP